MIAIINYRMGNLGSITNMIKYIGGNSVITSNISEISRAKKIILPGVGAFDSGMINLKRSGLIKLLSYKVLKENVPILGICLGMQLLSEHSEEGTLKGLGWIKGKTMKFNFNTNRLRIPHMGWNTIVLNKSSLLTKGLSKEARFYFVHSYYLRCTYTKDVLALTNHGHDFASIIENKNIYGVQFHPEKSHKYGMKLLKNFIEI
jgi:imidazole glycerol-phosphate synthase subunit HisH